MSQETIEVRDASPSYELRTPTLAVPADYKQTDVGVIPEDWEVTTLRDCLLERPSYGINAPAVPYTHRLPAYIRITDITEEGRFAPDPPVSVCSESSEHFFLSEGDIVFARTGASVGKSYLYRLEDGPLVYAGFLIRVRVDQQRLLPDFIAAYVTTARYWQWVRLMSMRSGQPGINGNEYSQLLIPLPSIAEQRAIATVLGDVDALLEGLDRLIAKKRDLKQAAMQQLLTGQTRLPGFEGEWEVRRLGELAEMGSGGTPLSSVPSYYDGDIPWVSIADMTAGGKVIERTEQYLTALGYANSAAQMFPSGTVLYAMYASLGECSIAGIPLCTSQAILGIRPKSGLNIEFLYYTLTSLKPRVKTLGQQGTQANLNKGMVQDFLLAVPSLSEQTAIATVLADMDAEIEALEQRRTKTAALKQAMMQELLTGRTRLV